VFVASGAPADWGGNIVKRFGSLAALLAVVLAAGACGRSGSGPSATPTTGAGSPTTAATSAGPGDFGTLKNVCGPGSPSGSPAQGVTPDSINVATSADPGFTGRLGLDQELFDAAEVFTKWCNDAGGINGRKIKLDEEDAKLFNFDAVIKKVCGTAFFFVGSGNVFDNNPGQKDRLQCLLPQVPAYVVTSEARDADLSVQPVPNRTDTIGVASMRYVEQQFPDATKAVVTMTGNVPATILVDQQEREAAQQLGWTLKGTTLQYPALGEQTWVPNAQQIKSAGAKGLIYTGEPQNLGLLEKALQQIDYKLDFILVAANHYDPGLFKAGGSAIRNTFIQIGFVPFFDAAKNPATQQYLDLFKKYKPSGKSTAVLGPQAFSAWLLWALAADKCGNDLTRKCVYDNLATVGGKDWTGGGLHAPQNVQDQTAGTCGIILEASSGLPHDGFDYAQGFKANSGLYQCSADNVLTLHGNYGKGETLADVGKTISDLK
jgi:ABC-type branched-subunit amino acid transport system substrate-binding protein